MSLGIDRGLDPIGWSRELGVSVEACELLAASDFIDLHLDLEVPVRLFGYDALRRHAPRQHPSYFFGHTDLPRLIESSLTGVVYDVATNPFRPRANRQRVTRANLLRVKERIAAHADDLALVRSHQEYVAARAAGKLALWLALQGGNALSWRPTELEELADDLSRITLVHLTNSNLGGTSSPSGRNKRLTPEGGDFVALCNAHRVLVDLAHASKATFWDALDVHAADLPPIVSHTGVDACRPHWRNLDDDQIRAIADRGGVIGIMYQSSFLAPTMTTCSRAAIIAHLAHVIELVGEEFAAIGTDYDGMIVPPSDLPDVTHHPLLVQDMLDQGWSERRIRGVLGGNYLRVVQAIRP